MNKRSSPVRFLYGFLALLLAAAAAGLCYLGIRGSGALMIGQPKDARAVLTAFSQKLSEGDLAGASEYIYGNPELTAAETGGAAGILWQKYLDSLDCSASDSIRATDTGLSGALLMRRMDLTAATDAVSQAAGPLAEQMEKGRKNVRDDEGVYTPEFLNEVLCAAAQQITPELCEERIPVELVRDGDCWRILLGTDLSRALSGGIS